MEQNTQQRSLIVELDEAKAELVQCMNHIVGVRKIPCYFLESMLSDILVRVREGARNELIAAKQQMKQGKNIKE